MAVHVHTCYTLDCDRYGKPIGYVYEDADYVPHFESETEARDKLVGDLNTADEDAAYNGYLEGEHLPDGSDICARCNTIRLCAERGHRWSGWGNCYCHLAGRDWTPGPHEPCTEHRARTCNRGYCPERERIDQPQSTEVQPA